MSENTNDSLRPEGHPALEAEGLEVLDDSTPWLNWEQMPEKPEGYLWGIRYRNHPRLGNSDRRCPTPLELLALIDSEERYIDKVYLPRYERGLPLRSLSIFPPLRKTDYSRHFFRTLRTQGLFGALAIAAALFFPTTEWAGLLFLFGLMFGIIPVFDTLIQWILYPGRKTPVELKRSQVHGAAFNHWIGTGQRSRIPIWTVALVFVTVFLAQWIDAYRFSNASTDVGLEEAFNWISVKGTIIPERILDQGEWWRLFTATLMHGNLFWVMHIGFNTLVFVAMGKYIHRLTHPLMVPLVFVISAFVGAVGSTLFIERAHPMGSLGASGGVVGLIGFLGWLMFVRRGVFPYEFRSQILRFIILLIVIGVLGSFFIDNAGHAGGFLGGIACGIIYDALNRRRWDIATTGGLRLFGGLSFVVLFFGAVCCMDLLFFDGAWIVERFLR